MIYKGSKLKKLVSDCPGMYQDLAERMGKYKRQRKNGHSSIYRLDSLYKDGHNIQINTLDALVKETGRPLDFFVDFEPSELSCYVNGGDGVRGNNNIINSSVSNDQANRIEYLTEMLKMKDAIINEKERVITLKEAEIELWKKRLDDAIKLAEFGGSDINRTLK